MEVKAKIYEEEIEENVKWLKHYCSMHQILLVGEGDFSFSLSLANAFGSAINIVATSYDTYDILLKKYSKAQSNVEELKKMGAAIVHEVDATNMKLHVGLRTRRFHRIVFNFPHAGFKGKEDHPQLIKLHRQLMRGFFRNASRMLRPYGEVHVSHKTAAPFCHWNLEELAAENSLLRVESADFCIEDYPGYNNKRGDGSRSDEPFPLGKCSTFKFIIGRLYKKKNPLRKIDLLPSSPSINPILDNHLDYGNIAIDSLRNADISYPEIHRPVKFVRIPRSVNCLALKGTIVENHLDYGNIAIDSLQYADINSLDINRPVNFERIPRSINGLAHRDTIVGNHLDYGNIAIDSLQYADISYPEVHRPVNFERIPRSINGLAHRNTNLRPFSRFNSLGLRMQGINDFEFKDMAPPPLCRIKNFSLTMDELQLSTFPGVSLPLISSYNTELLEAPGRLSLGYNYLRHYAELHSRRVPILECSRMFEQQTEWDWDEETRQRELFLCHGIWLRYCSCNVWIPRKAV